MEKIEQLWKQVIQWRRLPILRWVQTKSIKSTGIIVIVISLATFFVWLYFIFPDNQARSHNDYDQLTGIDQARIINEYRRNSVSMIGAIVTAIGGISLYLNFNLARKRLEQDKEKNYRDAELAEDKNVTDRFSKAVEMLADVRLEVRLGGIYALERIAKDSKEDHPVVMEVLTAFIRERAISPQTESDSFINEFLTQTDLQDEDRKSTRKPSQDIQSALTVIGRRNVSNDTCLIDLEGANLEGVTLYRANLEGANLCRVHLKGANLEEVNLEGARLHEVHLEEAILHEVHLEGAVLYKAHLQQAKLYKTHLEKASLYGAHLEKANLDYSYLNKASLKEAHLQRAVLFSSYLEGANLREANLESAVLWAAHLKRADFFRANLEEASLLKANLEEANLIEANLRGTHLAQANLKGTQLYRTNLETATGLTEGQLISALFCNTVLPDNITLDSDRDCDRLHT